jgi:hypothetical protein
MRGASQPLGTYPEKVRICRAVEGFTGERKGNHIFAHAVIKDLLEELLSEVEEHQLLHFGRKVLAVQLSGRD